MRSGSGRREGSRQRRGVDPKHESKRKRGWGACAALINGWDAMQIQCKRGFCDGDETGQELLLIGETREKGGRMAGRRIVGERLQV